MDLRNVNLDLFLIRHADPASLPNHWVFPHSPLSKRGIQKAKILGLALRRYSLDLLLSSPLTRARQTASIIAQKNPQLLPLHDPQKHSWCSEIDLGEFAGMSDREIIQKYPHEEHPPPRRGKIPSSIVFRLLMTQKDYKFPGGEGLEAFWNRVTQGFSHLIKNQIHRDKKKSGIVAHGGPFTVIALLLLGKTFNDTSFPCFFFHKADFTLIRIKDQQVAFLQSNPLNSSSNAFTSVIQPRKG